MRMYPFGGYPEPDRLPTDPDQIEEVETVGDAEDINLILHDPALRWRAKEFARMGFNPRQSRALALERSADTHFVENRLIRRGCEVDTAFQIACAL